MDTNPTEDLPALPESPLGVFADLLRSMESLLDVVVGYRAKCIKAGFSEETAELMACHLHQALCFQMSQPSKVDDDGA